jgi:hypothetical protein
MSEVSTDIGTKLLFENDRIRVWEMVLQPGEYVHVHRHVYDHCFVYTTPSRIRVEYSDSPVPVEVELPDGFVQYTEVGRDGLPPHRIRNIGPQVHRQILVELVGPSAAEHARTPESNAQPVVPEPGP